MVVRIKVLAKWLIYYCDFTYIDSSYPWNVSFSRLKLTEKIGSLTH